MRFLQTIVILCVCSSIASAYTFVFTNGKRIEGTIQDEDNATIRIIDSTGVAMTLKRNALNSEATLAANPVIVEPPVVETPAPEPVVVPTRPRPPISISFEPESHSETYWRDRLTRAKRDYARLQQDCRKAGGSRTGNEILQTRTYVVNGKTVKVTGYWADPENIKSANAVCKEAIEAHFDLMEARNELESTRTENEPSAASISSSVSGSNK
jgi:hypothetical protein